MSSGFGNGRTAERGAPERHRTLPSWAWWLAAVAVVVVAALEARQLFEFHLVQERVPKWDMAMNGWQGHELALDLRRGRPLRFLAHLNEHERFPLGYSLLVLPFSLVAGPTWAAATLVPAVSFALTPLVLLVLARRLDGGPVGWWGGLLGVALFLGSPMMRLFAVLIMREVPGALFSLVAIACYLRALERDSLASWRLAGLSALFLFFVKYNYGLMWMAAAGAHQVWILSSSARRRLGRAAARWLWPWRRPGRIQRAVASAVYILAALYILDLSPGGVVYALLVLTTIVVGIRWRSLGRRIVERVRSWPHAARAAAETVAAPVWIWCLSPDPVHPRAVLGFLRNRSSDLPWGEAASFYPQSFFADYVSGPVVGGAVLAGLAVALLSARRADGPLRVVALFVVVSLSLTLAHPYKLPRFLASGMPALFLLAGIGAARGFHAPWPAGAVRRVVGGLTAALAVTGLILARGARLDEHLESGYATRMGDPRLAEVLEGCRELVARDRPVGVIGTANELSPPLLEWTLHQRPVERGFRVVRPLPRIPPGLAEDELERRLTRWLDARRPEQIATIAFHTDSEWMADPGFRRFDAEQQRAVARMLEDPRWRTAGSRSYPELGIELTILERR